MVIRIYLRRLSRLSSYKDFDWYGVGVGGISNLRFQVYVGCYFLRLFRPDSAGGWFCVCRIHFGDPDLFVKLEELLK